MKLMTPLTIKLAALSFISISCARGIDDTETAGGGGSSLASVGFNLPNFPAGVNDKLGAGSTAKIVGDFNEPGAINFDTKIQFLTILDYKEGGKTSISFGKYTKTNSNSGSEFGLKNGDKFNQLKLQIIGADKTLLYEGAVLDSLGRGEITIRSGDNKMKATLACEALNICGTSGPVDVTGSSSVASAQSVQGKSDATSIDVEVKIDGEVGGGSLQSLKSSLTQCKENVREKTNGLYNNCYLYDNISVDGQASCEEITELTATDISGFEYDGKTFGSDIYDYLNHCVNVRHVEQPASGPFKRP